MGSKSTDKLMAIFQQHPGLPADVGRELVSLYDRKLWHELSLELRKVFASDAFKAPGVLRAIFVDFVMDFGHRINLLHFARFATDVSKQMDGETAVPFLQQHISQLQEVKGQGVEEAILFVQVAIAEHYIYMGKLDECKSVMEDGVKKLDSLPEADPVVSAAVWNVQALHAKARQDFAAYYRAALQYLCFVSLDDVPPAEQTALARDVALAALLGDSVYSFAELLLHPVVKALDGSPYAWLPELLHCFSDGDMARYESLCARHGAAMNAQPALVAAERSLKEKITIMCLVALLSSLPPDERCIPLAHVAARTRLDVDGAEFLLMKAMSLRLLEGVIDEVGGTVAVSWVQPRVLMRSEVAALRAHLQDWMGKVDAATALLEAEGVTTVESLA